MVVLLSKTIALTHKYTSLTHSRQNRFVSDESEAGQSKLFSDLFVHVPDAELDSLDGLINRSELSVHLRVI